MQLISTKVLKEVRMNRKFSFLFVLLFTIFLSASLFPAEEIKLISYYPAPFGAYLNLDAHNGYKQQGVLILTRFNKSTPPGSGNIFLGEMAGVQGANTGQNNTFLGYMTGFYNATGEQNTFVGYQAGYSNTAGSQNTFVGCLAGGNTTGDFNTFLGYSAGNNNKGGNYNTFLGSNAGGYNTASDNTFVGYQAGILNTTGKHNTFVGSGAGHENQAGDNNVFIGYSAGYNELGSNKLYISNSTTSTPLIYGDFSAGNVGIGTTGPSAKLHVNGNIKAKMDTDFSGNAAQWEGTTQGRIYELGYDIAELFETDEEVEPGDVLVINENGKLKKSNKPNDTKVGGIVSSAPAILFEGSELQIAPEPFKFQKGIKPPVALAGRVPCKVDASYGEIQPGDLLTTSPTPGHAMKAQPVNIGGIEIYRPGTIVGKALEPLKEGKGKILVFVSMI